MLGGVRVGMRVIDAATGRTFFRHGGTTLMDPASNQKVLATTAALMRLGAGFRFRTELTGPPPDGNGVINGDVILRGHGRPVAAHGRPRVAGHLAGRPGRPAHRGRHRRRPAPHRGQPRPTPTSARPCG